MATSARESREAGVSVNLRGGAGILLYLIFWGWLVARWLNDWILPEGVGAPSGTSFIDPAVVEPISGNLAFAVQYLPALASGAYMTLVLTVVSIILGFVIAVPVSVARVYGKRSAWVSLGFTELIRGTPLLAQLFVLYFGLQLSAWIRELPLVGEGFVPGQAFWVAIIGFTINSAAYQAEYIRSALISVERGQLTAARAVGLTQIEGIRYVVLPQALRYAIPGWSNELVYLIKYSSLAGFITVPELYHVGRRIASQNYRYTAMFVLVGLMYLAIVVSASTLMDYVENRTSIPGIGRASER